jgi:hypothetical protein
MFEPGENVEHRTPNVEVKSGGGGGIRTHEAFRPAGFQDRSHQPLDHPSRDCVRGLEIHYSITPLLQGESAWRSRSGVREWWRDGVMEGWRDGGMEGWRDGVMEEWRNGGMEEWSDGVME